jgi:hypothetical protein
MKESWHMHFQSLHHDCFPDYRIPGYLAVISTCSVSLCKSVVAEDRNTEADSLLLICPHD